MVEPYKYQDKKFAVDARGVSKKFCRTLRLSLCYGLSDMAREINPLAWSRSRPRSKPDHPLEQVTKPIPLRRGEFLAVDHVSFGVRRGECVGLIGHNGAGKTTLLKLLSGLIKPDAGTITMRGKTGAMIALGAGFNPILSARENIYVNGSILGMTKKQTDARIEEIIDFAELHDFIDMPVRSFSSGMVVRLGFAVASTLTPDILLLDEVLAVGDARFQAKCLNRLGELKTSGAALILVSHNMHKIARYCNAVMVMERGRCIYQGDTGAGIALLERTYADPPDYSDSPHAQEDAGTGKIRIQTLKFLNTSRQEIDAIRCGDSFYMELTCTTEHGYQEPFVVELVITVDGIKVHRARVPGTAKQNGPESRHLIAIRKFQVNRPDAKINILIWNASCTEILEWKRGINLPVQLTHNSTGLMHFETAIATVQ